MALSCHLATLLFINPKTSFPQIFWPALQQDSSSSHIRRHSHLPEETKGETLLCVPSCLSIALGSLSLLCLPSSTHQTDRVVWQVSEFAPVIRIMPKLISHLQAALQTRHTCLSLLSKKRVREWERSGWLRKQALCCYSLRLKKPGWTK